MAASPTSDSTTLFPPEDLTELLDLSRFLDTVTEPAMLLGPDGQQVALPLEVYQVLVKVAESMRQGHAISVMPRDLLLTTQEAADLLGESRPTLVKRLETGLIPYERTGAGRHRRIRLRDLLEYRDRSRVERRAILDQMAREAEELGLYDDAGVDYATALAAARANRAR